MAPFLLLHRWSSITSSPLFTNVFPKLSPLRANGFLLPKDGVFPVRLFAFPNSNRSSIQRILDGRRIGTPFICFHDARENSQPSSPQKGSAVDWPILERWDVPWQWQTIMLTMFACGLRQHCADRVGGSISFAVCRNSGCGIKFG